MNHATFQYFPSIADPRWRVAGLMALFLSLGVTFLGLNKTPLQIGWMIAVALAADTLLHFLLKDRNRFFFPLSALITGLGLSILTNFAHSWWLGALPVFLAIGSKYLFTANGKHIFNPGMFGMVVCLLFAEGLVAPASAAQWGGSGALIFFFVITALSLFVYNVGRSVLTFSFLWFYAIQVLLRAYWLETDIPASLLIDGIIKSPAFYLFTYFMLTDPATSPSDKRGQIIMALSVVIFDLTYHLLGIRFTLFYAGCTYFALRWAWLQYNASTPIFKRFAHIFKPVMVIGGILMVATYINTSRPTTAKTMFTGFKFEEISTSIPAVQGTVFHDIDPRIRHVAKWFFSLGDAVAVRDVNQDGLLDLFFTMPLKAPQDRAQLYLNQGGFAFTRQPITALDALREHPEEHGVPMDAVWFDRDNDGDQDLLIAVYGGHPILLENQLVELGTLDFIDISEKVGLTDYLNSATVNVFDINNDARPDIIIGGTLPALHPAYEDGRTLNLFQLPTAENSEDRRPINIMRRKPFDSRNGGENVFYFATENGYQHISNQALLIDDQSRWTLDIGTGDVNQDGWVDLYISNTAGPDNLLINQQGNGFAEVRGSQRDEIGQDTYRGMNASLADVDGNGALDIYVSNMHKPEAPEGSLLWMNDGNFALNHAQSFTDLAFKAGANNHGNFGWGAAIGDLNRDGKLDILQMNGWLDDAYDTTGEENCPAYEYKMFQVEATPPDTHGYADNWPSMEGTCMYPKERKRAYMNLGNGKFKDHAEQIGWQQGDNAKAVALADLDNDGALDAIVTRMTAAPSIYRNRPSENAYWLGLKLQGNGTNCLKDALGSRIIAHYVANGITHQQIREVTASNGLSAQSDDRVLFGFGTIKPEQVSIEIHWCGYDERIILEPTLNQYHNITQFP